MRTTALVIAGGVLAAASFGVWFAVGHRLISYHFAPIGEEVEELRDDLARAQARLEEIEAASAVALQLAARNAEAIARGCQNLTPR